MLTVGSMPWRRRHGEVGEKHQQRLGRRREATARGDNVGRRLIYAVVASDVYALLFL
jgi:hypothetical protein